ncbi:IclR family transcriptional regulator C-terminal domain-containing protein (plasmid) [Komagataeibacter sucrofermentans]|uniref:IclR family transcriptional regulator n=1 Tax=Komagataeibacter sucrofermentans TaxID=1053551 RepID=A0A318QJS8_9PROT|nr:IclR family transcriptional regulator C-terminal domain-containing protein [Komagataeibacter sucrofermentans]PYD77628.1 IclR family transcriptional regulator [Komagataeibacter sucrofermentans]GBQ47549.1 IclR family transcriptional regulator [Komagataeibacter sucrofermentans DSM 15973]
MAKLRERDATLRAQNAAGRDFSEALARGLSVISVFNATRPALSLADIARIIDLPRATVRRTLLTLVHLGYMSENGRLFSLRPTILQLASAYLGADPIATILQPICEELATRLEVTCSVAVLDGYDAVMVAYASPRKVQAYGVLEGIGLRLPAFCSAVGGVLLASLSESARENFLKDLVPENVTALTVTDKAVLRARWNTVHEEGYALIDQEAEIGYRALAVPVFRHDGRPIAALNVGMRIEQATPDEMKQQYLPCLRDVTESLRTQLL